MVSPDLTQREKLEALLSTGQVLRMKDLAEQGITAATVRRAVEAGTVISVSRGVYRRAGAETVPYQEYAEVVARAPEALICLFSAATFHDLGTESPDQVWIAIPNSRKPPRLEWPKMRVVQWRSEEAFDIGVERHEICGVSVHITGAARTVVDMLRMSSTIGEDAALEALRTYTRQSRSPEELLDIADQIGLSRRLSSYLRAYSQISRP